MLVAHMFKKLGYPAERGQQYCGMQGNPDVTGIPYIWPEVKWNEQLDLEEAMKQAERDSNGRRLRTGEDLLPVVIHKKSRQPWHCTMRTIDFLSLCGSMPFSVIVPTEGLVTMEWEDWIQIYMAYEAERREG